MDASTILRRADLNLVPALAALLDQRHVTRAAETLGIGQPAMSSALARLRRLFDDPLLVRNGRVMELTPMGRALLDPVHNVLAGLEQLLTVAPAFDPKLDSRSFTIAASDYVTLVLLRPLLEQLERDSPGIAVDVVPVDTVSTPTAVDRIQIDMAIVPQRTMTSRTSHLQRLELFTEHYVPVVWTNNHEVGDTLDESALQRLSYIASCDESCGPALIDRTLARLGITPRVMLTTRSIALVPLLLPGTQSFGFVQQRLLQQPHLRRELRPLRTTLSIEPILQQMYWHPALHRDPAHRWLRDRIASLAATV
ncbi:LysR substrate-binding domain-containing protein [Mycobacterium sp. AZCC_0083]|uniref:LysR substrate-binding domain-containing protein n=1 Tax=Mycobacterium sp. AZCC_0083 TaxID=2735882 RepID=UPI001607BC83|nr:LysR substrate-binding domain-containing protein [Mycobacterium sp. AZCC_0083]MBB5167556.1 DNA-binding transcriptional LysR family regulator [Mycobacterium sp. AZCC_0083]